MDNSNNSNILNNTQESNYYQILSTDVLSSGLIILNKPNCNKIKFIKKTKIPKSSPCSISAWTSYNRDHWNYYINVFYNE